MAAHPVDARGGGLERQGEQAGVHAHFVKLLGGHAHEQLGVGGAVGRRAAVHHHLVHAEAGAFARAPVDSASKVMALAGPVRPSSPAASNAAPSAPWNTVLRIAPSPDAAAGASWTGWGRRTGVSQGRAAWA